MKFRSAIVLVVALGALVVPMSATATNCDSPIYIFSSKRVQTEIDDPTRPGTPVGRTVPSIASAAVGCTVVRNTVVGSEDPSLPHELYDTDFIYPGANRMSVRFLENGRDPSVVESAVLEFAGTSFVLTLTPGVDTTGAPTQWMDSQVVIVDQWDTYFGNEATATICLVDNGGCYSRTYRTVNDFLPVDIQ